MTTEIVDLRSGTQLSKGKKDATSSGTALKPVSSKEQPSLSQS